MEHFNEAEFHQFWDMVLMIARTAQFVSIEDVQKAQHTISMSRAPGCGSARTIGGMHDGLRCEIEPQAGETTLDVAE